MGSEASKRFRCGCELFLLWLVGLALFTVNRAHFGRGVGNGTLDGAGMAANGVMVLGGHQFGGAGIFQVLRFLRDIGGGGA